MHVQAGENKNSIIINIVVVTINMEEPQQNGKPNKVWWFARDSL